MPTIANDWQSSLVPPTIRRPWIVFQEDIEFKLADLASEGLPVDPSLRDDLTSIKIKGVRAVFGDLPQDQQRAYAEVSLMELSAYARWRAAQVATSDGLAVVPSEFNTEWDMLDCDDKASWVPRDARASLASDAIWAPLLEDGGPPLPPSNGLEAEDGPGADAEAAAKAPQAGVAPAPIKGEADLAPVPIKTDPAAAPNDRTEAEEKRVASVIADAGAALAVMASGDGGATTTTATVASAAVAGSPTAANRVESRDGVVNTGPDQRPNQRPGRRRGRKAVSSPSLSPTATTPTAVSTKARPMRACRAAAETATPCATVAASAVRKRGVKRRGPCVLEESDSDGDDGAKAEEPDRKDERARGSGAGTKASKALAPSPGTKASKALAPSPAAAARDQQHTPQTGGRSARIRTARSSPRSPASTQKVILPAPTRAKGVDEPLVLRCQLPPVNLSMEALDAICEVCGKGDVTDDNDLALCDRCDRGFHQKCHEPQVSFFGRPDDQWFCAACTKELAQLRKLRVRVADFVWAGLAGVPWWPARVLCIDFTSLADTKPYWVQFFETGPPKGIWAGEAQVLPWLEGPDFASVQGARRRLAIRLAEADGAVPISGTAQQAPIKPLPKLLPPQRSIGGVVMPRSSARRRHYPPSAPPSQQEGPMEEELSQQVQEMRELVMAASARQDRLEKVLGEALSASPAGEEQRPAMCRSLSYGRLRRCLRHRQTGVQ